MPFTTNLNLERPVNGSYVGTWDVPVNSNWDLLDSAAGGVASVALSNIPVALSAAQYANNFINFTGTLTGNVEVTFPAVGRFWMVQNNCVANTAFKVTCWVSSAQQYVALPPNEPIAIMSDGTNIKFVGLGRIGTYWDFGGSSVPIWVEGSNPAPYLNCDGTAFSSATYPALRDYLGGTTLPDSKGRVRATLNQGSGRLTGSSSLNGVDGNTLLAGGGSQTIGVTNLPNYDLSVADHVHDFAGISMLRDVGSVVVDTAAAQAVPIYSGSINNTGSPTAPVTAASGGSDSAYAPPSYIGGITMIRAG